MVRVSLGFAGAWFACGLVAAACGGDSRPASPPSTAESTAESTPTGATVTQEARSTPTNTVAPATEGALMRQRMELGFSACPLAPSEPRMALGPSFKVGDTRHYTMRKSTQKQNGIPTEGFFDVSLSVLEKSSAGYVIEWLTGPPRLTLSGVTIDTEFIQSVAAASNSRLEVVMDGDGNLVGVRNLAEVREAVNRGLDLVEAELERSEPGRDHSTEIAAARRQALSDAFLTAVAFKEPSAFFSLTGFEFDGRKEVTTTGKTGAYGRPVTASEKLTLDRASDTCATLKFIVDADKVEAAKAFAAFLKDQVRGTSSTPPDASAIMIEAFVKESRGSLDVPSGWPRFARWVFSVRGRIEGAGGGLFTQTEFIEFALQP